MNNSKSNTQFKKKMNMDWLLDTQLKEDRFFYNS